MDNYKYRLTKREKWICGTIILVGLLVILGVTLTAGWYWFDWFKPEPHPIVPICKVFL